MAGIIDQLQEKAARDENQALSIAAKDATWANQFNSIPPVEKLRANLNLANVIDGALRRKQELLAQSDLKAQELLHREKKFEQWQKDAPLRTELLQKRVESEGAHERFAQRKDAESMADISGFFDSIAKIPARPGTPEYKSALNAALQKHPRVIGTQAGADALKNLQREHEDIAALQPPPGMEFDRMDFDSEGKAKAVFKPIPPPSAVTLPDGMVPSGATVNKRGDVSVNYSAPKAEKDAVMPSLEKERGMHAKMLDRAKRIRSKATDAAVIADADADILESERALADVESQIRTHREGVTKPAATPAAAGPAKIASAADFAALPSGTEFIDPQGVKRRKP
jgi:hypothetical protein